MHSGETVSLFQQRDHHVGLRVITASLIEADLAPETLGSVEESMFPFAMWVRGVFPPSVLSW